MNVFDFDGTIYHGDSERDFFFYCLKKYPKTRKKIPKCLLLGLGYGLKIVKKDKFKQYFLSFLSLLDDVDKAVIEFWDANEGKIHKWYHKMKQPSDVIISASPEFFLKPIAKRLGAECVMGTLADKHTGKYEVNCHGANKVVRFREVYPDAQIDEFYSDRYSDTPLAKLAKKAVLVKGERLGEWKKFK